MRTTSTTLKTTFLFILFIITKAVTEDVSFWMSAEFSNSSALSRAHFDLLITTSINNDTSSATTSTTTTTTAATSPPLPVFSMAGRVCLATVLVVVVVVGVCGNSVLCVLVYRKAAMRSAINLLVAQLALSDVLLSAAVMPFAGVGLFLPADWAWRLQVCAMQVLVHDVLVTLNTCLLLAISVDRYLIIVHRQEKLNVRRARVLILVAWAFSLLTGMCPLMGWGRWAMYPGHPQCWDVVATGPSDLSFVVFSCLVSRYLPVAAIFYSYLCIASRVRRKNLKVGHYPLTVGVTQTSGSTLAVAPPQPRVSVSGALREFSSPEPGSTASSLTCPVTVECGQDPAGVSSILPSTSPVRFVPSSQTVYLHSSSLQNHGLRPASCVQAGHDVCGLRVDSASSVPSSISSPNFPLRSKALAVPSDDTFVKRSEQAQSSHVLKPVFLPTPGIGCQTAEIDSINAQSAEMDSFNSETAEVSAPTAGIDSINCESAEFSAQASEFSVKTSEFSAQTSEIIAQAQQINTHTPSPSSSPLFLATSGTAPPTTAHGRTADQSAASSPSLPPYHPPSSASSARHRGSSSAWRKAAATDMNLKTRTFKTILLLSLLLVSCLIPYVTAVLVTSWTHRCRPALLCLLLWLQFLKSALNPVVYVSRIRKFREACRDACPRACCVAWWALPRCLVELLATRRVDPSSVYQCAEHHVVS